MEIKKKGGYVPPKQCFFTKEEAQEIALERPTISYIGEIIFPFRQKEPETSRNLVMREVFSTKDNTGIFPINGDQLIPQKGQDLYGIGIHFEIPDFPLYNLFILRDKLEEENGEINEEVAKQLPHVGKEKEWSIRYATRSTGEKDEKGKLKYKPVFLYSRKELIQNILFSLEKGEVFIIYGYYKATECLSFHNPKEKTEEDKQLSLVVETLIAQKNGKEKKKSVKKK